MHIINTLEAILKQLLSKNSIFRFFSLLITNSIIAFILTPQISRSFSTDQIDNHHMVEKIHSNDTSIKKNVLQLAIKARECAIKKGLNPKNDIITIIDYSLPSAQERLFIIDLNKGEVMYSLYTAHGAGSGNNYADRFSDQPQSHQSSLGVFLTGETYQGRHGTSLSLIGMEKNFNANAYKRRLVIHAANYVSADFVKKHGRLGRSHGCPALDPKYTKEVIEKIKSGTLLVNYYPDPRWINQSEYLNC